METYRATLRPRSATRSPWQADTLFGQLCWLLLYEEGEAALAAFLERYHAKEPPLLFSDGFPGDWLPRPLVPAPPAPVPRDKAAQVSAMRAAKRVKSIHWVRPDEFDALRRGERGALEAPRLELNATRTVLKNQINRLTGATTGPEGQAGGGNLYNVEELAFVASDGKALDVSIYVRAADAEQARRAERLLEGLARSGYGAKKSAGYGHFELVDWQPFPGFDGGVPDPNGFVSLSSWVPAAGDPTEGFYTTRVKYGKLGEELARSDNPFKFPLIMLAAGSAFYSGGPPREWYGRLVAGIAPIDERVVHYGLAFAVPARLAPEE